MATPFDAPTGGSQAPRPGAAEAQAPRELEERLRASEEYFRTVVEQASDGIFIADPSGRYVDVNAAGLEMLGYSREEILGLSIADVLAPDDVARVPEELGRLRGGRALTSQWSFRRKDGTLFRGEVHGLELPDSRLLGYVRDITERTRAEESLEHSRAMLESFVEHTPAAVAMLDRNLRYVAVSRRWLQDYDLGDRDVRGQHHYDVFPEVRNMPEWQSVHQRCLAGAVERREEDPFVRADGHTDWLRWEVRPWRDEQGDIGGIIMYTEVITERKTNELRLKESETLFRGLVDTSPIPMLVVTADDEGRVLLMNRRFSETFGYTMQDVPDSRSWWRRAYPDPAYRERVQTSWRDAIEVADRAGVLAIAPVLAEVTCLDGRVRHLEVHMGRFGDRALVLFSDLTERRHTEELLKKSEERYRLIVENQTEFIVKWWPDGTRTFVNESYCRTFGEREEDCVGTSFFPLIAPEYREVVSRQIAALTPGSAEYTEEHLSLVRGVRRWQQWTNRGIFDAEGRLVEVLSSGRDVTERKDAEEKLRRSQTHLLASQHIARVGSWEMDLASLDDLSRNPIRWSDECFRIFGYEPADAAPIGEVFLRRVHPDDRQRVRDAARLAISTKSPYVIDYRILIDDGTERVIHEQAEFIIDGAGAPIKFIGTTQDITDRVRLEEQLRQSQKMQAIGQLAGGVAHDFNNLLTVINGHVEMLLDRTSIGDETRDELAAIRDAGERAALLTRQLLLFSRKAVLEPRILDCGDLVQRTSQMLRRLISEEVVLSTVLPPSLGRIKADPSQIEQVIMNLALNACDAMPLGGRLTIETRNVSFDAEFCRSHPEYSPGSYVQLVVGDTGFGMTPQVKAHLFEPFFTTKGPGRGTGLGLATVYGIVQESGGFLTVMSEVDAGTTFNVYLPALDAAESPRSTASVDRDRLRGRETVLLVEDDPAVRRITKLALTKYGYEVIEAGAGDAALRLSDEQDRVIDILVSDVVMPGMSGRRLADALLVRRPGCRVLFMSGYNEDMLADRGTFGVSEGFIQKPFAPVALVAKVREVLDRVV